jgi:type I restriction enzyme S subunit
MEGPLIEALVVGSVERAATLTLGEVGDFVRGRRFTKEQYVPKGLGCIHYGQVHTHFGRVAEQSLTFLPEHLRDRLRLARRGDVVIAATSEDVDGLGKATVWLGTGDVAVHDDCYIFRHRLDPRFAAYLFVSPWFQQQKQQYASGTKVTRITGADLAKIEIPVPPLAVQARIGATLHEVSSHVDALRTELASARRLRASLLTIVLSQQVEIPESYDVMMDEAARREVAKS